MNPNAGKELAAAIIAMGIILVICLLIRELVTP